MFTKFAVAFSVLALAAATAGSIPVKGPTRQVILTEPAVVQGTALKAGEYKVSLAENKVTFIMGKELSEVPVKIETGEKRYDQNQVQYDHLGSQTTIKEICLGGTKTKLIFN
jgi:hypothetical protein